MVFWDVNGGLGGYDLGGAGMQGVGCARVWVVYRCPRKPEEEKSLL